MTKKNPSKKEASKKNSAQKHWGLLVLEVTLLLVWVGASVIASQFLIGYIILWVFGSSAFDLPVVTALFMALSYVLALVLIITIPPRIRNLHRKDDKKEKIFNREEMGIKGLPTWTDIGLAPVGYVVYLVLATGITALFELFTWFNTSEIQQTGFSPFLVGVDRLVAFFALVIMAPIAEEMIFRGWLYGKLRVRLSKEVGRNVSILISTILVSLLFGLVHGQWNVGINVFAMSLVLCGLREVTGTIYSGIILHMIKNGIAFYLLYVAGFGS